MQPHCFLSMFTAYHNCKLQLLHRGQYNYDETNQLQKHNWREKNRPLTFCCLLFFMKIKSKLIPMKKRRPAINKQYNATFNCFYSVHTFKFVRNPQEPRRKLHAYHFLLRLHSPWHCMTAAWWVEDNPTSQMGSTALWPCPSEMAVLQHLSSHWTLPSRKPLNPGNSRSEAMWHSMFFSALIRVALKLRTQFTVDLPLMKWGRQTIRIGIDTVANQVINE